MLQTGSFERRCGLLFRKLGRLNSRLFGFRRRISRETLGALLGQGLLSIFRCLTPSRHHGRIKGRLRLKLGQGLLPGLCCRGNAILKGRVSILDGVPQNLVLPIMWRSPHLQA